MPNRRQVLILFTTLLVGASALLGGCGQKGPLYLPAEVEQEELEEQGQEEQKEGSDSSS